MNTATPKKVMYCGTEYEVLAETPLDYYISLGYVPKDQCTQITEVPKWVKYKGKEYEVEEMSTGGTAYFLKGRGYVGLKVCTPCDAPNNELPKVPTSYKLNVPCFEHDKGDVLTLEQYKSAHDRVFIPQYEKPSYTVLLSNGNEVHLTSEDVENIIKLASN